MRATGFVVRFVDVVLILLFGFISISNMQNTRVDLPKSGEAQPVSMDAGEVVYVGVLPGGAFLIEGEKEVLDSIEALRAYLQRERQRAGAGPLKVRIRSNRDAAVRHVFEVAALCDEMGLPKSLEVELALPE